MKKPIVAWSHSVLNLFETCPKKYYHLRVKKDFKEDFDNPAANYGKEAHKHFENFLIKDTQLPMDLMHHQKMLQKIKDAPGEGYAEQQLAINQDFDPTGWFDKDVYCRAIVDYMKVNGDKCIMFDWKFGKMKDEFDQLKLFIGVVSIFQPQVEEFTAAFYWAKDKKFTRMKVTRAEVPQLWNDILPRVHRLEHAIKTTDFPDKPSGLCKKYCVVTSCPNNGEY